MKDVRDTQSVDALPKKKLIKINRRRKDTKTMTMINQARIMTVHGQTPNEIKMTKSTTVLHMTVTARTDTRVNMIRTVIKGEEVQEKVDIMVVKTEIGNFNYYIKFSLKMT